MNKGVDYTGVTVVFLCHDGKGNILLSKRGEACRDEQGTWDPGGGGVEFGDTVEDTLAKEIKEEYGTDIFEHTFMGFRDVHREHNGKKTHWIALDYLVHVDPSKVINGEPHKLDEVAWFSLKDLPIPQHSQFQFFLKKYDTYISKIAKNIF